MLSQSYGLKECKAIAHSYKSEEAMKRAEHGYLFDRLVKKKKGAKTEAKAEEKKEEKAEAKEEK